jgi:dipeptidyl aminopeptidase/acylaminoacyl peptidase
MKVFVALAAVAQALSAIAQPSASHETSATPAPPESEWAADEGRYLTHVVQLTTPDRYIKAGEAYFSPDVSHIIFQAIPKPMDGSAPESFYQMFVAKVKRDASGHITGIEDEIRLSPPGSANSCGWFHPTQPNRVLMASTLVPPAMKDVPGYQRSTGRYVWQFHSEMKIVECTFTDAKMEGEKKVPGHVDGELKPIISRDGYSAECSWSKDGRYILFAAYDRARSEKLGRNHLDILIHDTKTQKTIPLVQADGYNGGPFFSPDGKSICYRSDRKGNDLLQVYTAALVFDPDGVPSGIKDETNLTNNEHVNWGPFWHPSGGFLVYASSQMGHTNYEVFQIEPKSERASPLRITYADGADVLPAFSADGATMIWTSQRGALAPGEQKPSSQLWAADFHPAANSGSMNK